MTIEEYSQRMGYDENCCLEEYEVAHMAYLRSGLRKDTFYLDYSEHKESEIIASMSQAIGEFEKMMSDVTKERQSNARKLLAIASKLWSLGLDDQAEALEKMAWAHTSLRFCAKEKLTQGYALSDADKEFLLSLF